MPDLLIAIAILFAAQGANRHPRKFLRRRAVGTCTRRLARRRQRAPDAASCGHRGLGVRAGHGLSVHPGIGYRSVQGALRAGRADGVDRRVGNHRAGGERADPHVHAHLSARASTCASATTRARSSNWGCSRRACARAWARSSRCRTRWCWARVTRNYSRVGEGAGFRSRYGRHDRLRRAVAAGARDADRGCAPHDRGAGRSAAPRIPDGAIRFLRRVPAGLPGHTDRAAARVPKCCRACTATCRTCSTSTACRSCRRTTSRDPAQAKVVPKEHWYAAPAAPPK